MRAPDKAVMLITHYQRLLDYVKPDFVHVLADGRITRSGGAELAHELEREGYGAVARTDGVILPLLLLLQTAPRARRRSTVIGQQAGPVPRAGGVRQERGRSAGSSVSTGDADDRPRRLRGDRGLLSGIRVAVWR